MSYAEISLLKCDAAKFNETVALYPDAADTANLGQAAKWSAEAKQLLAYNGTYMIGVTVDVKDKNTDAPLTAARQLTALILEKP